MIISLIGICLAFVFLLYFVYNTSPIPHAFERTFSNTDLQPSLMIELEDKGFYFAGVTIDNIYLGNRASLLKLWVIDHTLTDTSCINLVGEKDYELRTAKLTVHPPNFYISDHVSHQLFRGKLKDYHFSLFSEKQFFIAGRAVPLSENSFVIRTWKDSLKELELAKQTSDPPYLRRATELLEKQIDGVFCIDGTLAYNQELNKLIYVYYYRNEFICTDTSMNLHYRGNTIDTVSIAGIQLARVESANKTTTSAPKKLTNSYSTTYGPWLFIRSRLMAQNEKEDKFLEAAVIDVYDLTDEGTYTFSFYLPKYKKHKARDFKVFGNRILALYNRYLVIYDLESDFFPSPTHNIVTNLSY